MSDEWATHKVDVVIRGRLTTHELRLPIDVTQEEIQQIADEFKRALRGGEGA